MKKVLVGLGVVVALFIVAIIVIPLVVDVDQYRPKIVAAVNDRLNGKLELGHLELSLWGTISVSIEGLNLEDAQSRKVISVKDAYVRIPWTSLLGGSPLLTFKMDRPEVRVVKEANGKLNVTTLMKETADKPAEAGAAGAADGKAKGDVKLPAFVTNARVGVDLTDALLYYKDEAQKSETVTKNLNLRVKDLSLSRATEVEISGLIESKAEDVFKVAGPFNVAITADPKVSGGKFQSLSAKLDANFDDIEIEAGGAFHKQKGVKARIEGNLTSTPESLDIGKLQATFFNAVIDVSGKVTNLKAADGQAAADPSVDLTVKSNDVDLSKWVELVPMLKDYSLEGKAKIDLFARGPSSKLGYGGDFTIRDLKAKSPILKAEPVVNVSVKIATDKIERFLATMKAPGNDVTIEGSVVSFTAPKVDLKGTSQSLDLDQLIALPPSPKDARDGKGGDAPKSAGLDSSKTNYDALLEPLRANPTLGAMVLAASFNAKLIKYYDIRMTDFSSRMSMKNLVASIDNAQITIFDGKFNLRAQTAMRPRTPTYTFGMSIAGLDLRKAVASRLELMKDTLVGKLSLKLDGSGASYNPDPAVKNLNAKGSFRVDNAIFATIDVGKMVAEGLNKALEKIPQAKGKVLKTLDKTSKYEYIATDFTISGGRLSAPNFQAKALKDQGLDVKGATQIGLLDKELKADWEISDPYNITKAGDLMFEVAHRKIPLLAESGKGLVLPITIGCKYTDPCPSYGKLVEHFGQVALKNTKKGATEAVKEEAKEKAKDVGKKLLKGLFH